MVDLVVAVADPVAWHEENLRRNRSHYTFLGSFGGAAIARIQEDFGAGLYYNTLVRMGAARVLNGETPLSGMVSPQTPRLRHGLQIPIPAGVRGFQTGQKMKYGASCIGLRGRCVAASDILHPQR